jgi:hypothetical protein
MHEVEEEDIIKIGLEDLFQNSTAILCNITLILRNGITQRNSELEVSHVFKWKFALKLLHNVVIVICW